jgi:hypothetical protein
MAKSSIGITAKTVWIIGIGAVAAAAYAWLGPKFSKPKVVAVPAAPASIPMAPPAQSSVAATSSLGPVRNYNLAGLAIEENDDYPSNAGVTLSGI